MAGSKSGQGVSVETIREMNLKVFPTGAVMCTCSCAMGTTAIVEAPLVSNQTFIGLVPGPRITSRFLFYLMTAAKPELNALGTGAIQQYLSRNDFSTFRIPLPTPFEQDAIAGFLDQETARIDELVAKKQRLIELLEDKRTALISQAVTKGLDPSVPMKSSGVSWLGDMPLSWEMLKIGRVARILSGIGFPDALQGVTGAPLPFYKVSDMTTIGNETYLDESVNTVTHSVARELGGRIIPEGAIVFPKVGAALLTNKRRITTRKCLVDNNVMALVPTTGLAEFWFFLLRNIDFVEIAQQGPVPSISAGQVRELSVPIPPSNEQAGIVEYLTRERDRIGRVIKLLAKQLDLLAEYRQALITAAVTGQINVTGPASDPEEALA